MKIKFDKYQGTGNDFIIVNGIAQPQVLKLTPNEVKGLCDRHFGIGADGLMILTEDLNSDFLMTYYNADGHESTMCGNGGRCLSAFAYEQGVCQTEAEFNAVDGLHKVRITEDHIIELQMKDVSQISRDDDAFILDTGSPHYVTFVDDYHEIDIVAFGKSIRYSNQYSLEGINVNVASLINDRLHVKTYERGVEDETYSCGTGVTASAIAASLYYPALAGESEVKIISKGGDLKVRFRKESDDLFTQVWLCGPATKVYSGMITL